MGTVVTAGILIVLVIIAIVSLIKRKKNGKSFSCGGDCSHCDKGC